MNESNKWLVQQSTLFSQMHTHLLTYQDKIDEDERMTSAGLPLSAAATVAKTKIVAIIILVNIFGDTDLVAAKDCIDETLRDVCDSTRFDRFVLYPLSSIVSFLSLSLFHFHPFYFSRRYMKDDKRERKRGREKTKKKMQRRKICKRNDRRYS